MRNICRVFATRYMYALRALRSAHPSEMILIATVLVMIVAIFVEIAIDTSLGYP